MRPAEFTRSRRPGAATIEFAVCLPILALLAFGSIEAASFLFLKQSLQVAAYEGLREAIRHGATDQSSVEAAAAILEARQVHDARIEFPDRDIRASVRGEPIVIEVSAPTRSNSPLAGQWAVNRTVRSRMVMLKE